MNEKTEEKSFEELLDAVEKAVSKLQAGGIPLEQALALYEQGFGDLKRAQERLSAARSKLELLKKDASAEP